MNENTEIKLCTTLYELLLSDIESAINSLEVNKKSQCQETLLKVRAAMHTITTLAKLNKHSSQRQEPVIELASTVKH